MSSLSTWPATRGAVTIGRGTAAHLRARADGDADVGRRKRRRVVHAVTHHGHHAALRLQRLDGSRFPVRPHLGRHVLNAKPRGDAAGGRPRVAGEQVHVYLHTCRQSADAHPPAPWPPVATAVRVTAHVVSGQPSVTARTILALSYRCGGVQGPASEGKFAPDAPGVDSAQAACCCRVETSRVAHVLLMATQFNDNERT